MICTMQSRHDSKDLLHLILGDLTYQVKHLQAVSDSEFLVDQCVVGRSDSKMLILGRK